MLDCYRTGRPVSAVLSEATGRWPNFTTAATGEGFASVLALPLRLRDRVIGALNLFDTSAGTFSDPATNSVGQAMADVATIAILQGRISQSASCSSSSRSLALTSRVTIEQAKGVLSASLDIEMEEAFAPPPAFAR